MIEELKNIKDPSSLLKYMAENFCYGFVKKSNNKIITRAIEKDWSDIWLKEYFLQKPQELIKNKCGVCWDFVEFEEEWFKNNGYEIKKFYMAVVKEGGSNLPTHTFLAYLDKTNWYWFEYSWGNEVGIHEYDSLEDLIKDANKKHIKSILEKGASLEDIENHKVYEYKKVNFGDGPIEFVTRIIKNSK